MALKNWHDFFNAGNGRCTYCDVDLLASLSSFWYEQRSHVIARAARGGDDRVKGALALLPYDIVCLLCFGQRSQKANSHGWRWPHQAHCFRQWLLS